MCLIFMYPHKYEEINVLDMSQFILSKILNMRGFYWRCLKKTCLSRPLHVTIRKHERCKCYWKYQVIFRNFCWKYQIVLWDINHNLKCCVWLQFISYHHVIMFSPIGVICLQLICIFITTISFLIKSQILSQFTLLRSMCMSVCMCVYLFLFIVHKGYPGFYLWVWNKAVFFLFLST